MVRSTPIRNSRRTSDAWTRCVGIARVEPEGSMNRDTVLAEHRDGVALITMNRPEKRNAFNDQQYDDLRAALMDAQHDDAIKVAVLTGAPGAFSGGQDLGEMVGQRTHGDGQPHGFRSVHRLPQRVRQAADRCGQRRRRRHRADDAAALRHRVHRPVGAAARAVRVARPRARSGEQLSVAGDHRAAGRGRPAVHERLDRCRPRGGAEARGCGRSTMRSCCRRR